MAFLVTALVTAFIVGTGVYSWHALKAHNEKLKGIDKSRLNDLSQDEWDKDE